MLSCSRPCVCKPFYCRDTIPSNWSCACPQLVQTTLKSRWPHAVFEMRGYYSIKCMCTMVQNVCISYKIYGNAQVNAYRNKCCKNLSGFQKPQKPPKMPLFIADTAMQIDCEMNLCILLMVKSLQKLLQERPRQWHLINPRIDFFKSGHFIRKQCEDIIFSTPGTVYLYSSCIVCWVSTQFSHHVWVSNHTSHLMILTYSNLFYK